MDINTFITIFIIWGIAVITPGPNFFITIHTAVETKSNISFFTVLGIVIGTFIWAVSGFLGISILFKTVPYLYLTLKIFGGLYLMYIGLKLIFKKKINLVSNFTPKSSFECFRLGLFTNLLNPKTAIFMTSLFAATIPSNVTLINGLLYVFLICLISAIWYASVSLLFSHNHIKEIYEKKESVIEKFAGMVFIGFGIKLVTSKL